MYSKDKNISQQQKKDIVGSKVILVSCCTSYLRSVTFISHLLCVASLANSALTSEQVADTSNEDTSKSSSNEESVLTTTGEGKAPPLAEDLKEALRGGVEVSRAPAPAASMTVTVPNKLNPAAPNFIPMSTATYLDPTSSAFTPSNPRSSSSPGPIYTKNSIPAATSSAASSRLNPAVKEFVPSLMPPVVANGDVGMYDNGDMLDDELDISGYMEAKHILSFERAAPTESSDLSSEAILQGAAEMLLKVYNYPASFDEIGKGFQLTLNSKPPTEDTLVNLAEMMVHWVCPCLHESLLN